MCFASSQVKKLYEVLIHSKNPLNITQVVLHFLNLFSCRFFFKKKLIHHDWIMLTETKKLSLLCDFTLDQEGCVWLCERDGVIITVGTISRKALSSYLAECLPVYFHDTNDCLQALTDYVSLRTTSESGSNVLMIPL